MMKNKSPGFHAALGICLLAFLSACGGGGSGGSAEPAVPLFLPNVEIFAGDPSAPPEHRDGQGTAARFVQAGAITVDSFGTAYVTEGIDLIGNHAVRKVSSSRDVSTPWRSAQDLLLASAGVATDDNGTVFFGYWAYCGLRCQQPSAEIRTIDVEGRPGSIAIIGSSDGTSAYLSRPTALARDLLGNLYYGDVTGRVVKISSEGVLATLLPQEGVHDVGGIAVDSAGNVYATNRDEIGLVRRVSPGGEVTVIGRIPWAMGIAVDEGGNVYVASPTEHVIRSIRRSGQTGAIVGMPGVRSFAPGPLPATLDTPVGVAVRGHDMYITMDRGIVVVRDLLQF
jgi:hypothetical protein